MGKTNRILVAMAMSIVLFMTSGMNVHAEGSEVTKEDIELMTIDVCSDYMISPELIQAIIEAESNFDINAKNGNCIGLMQINPTCHKDRMEKLNVTDLNDPYQNIVVGVDYIADLIDISFDKGYGCDMYYILMRYNMRTDTANRLFEAGQYSKYAKRVVKRAWELSEQHYYNE